MTTRSTTRSSSTLWSPLRSLALPVVVLAAAGVGNGVATATASSTVATLPAPAMARVKAGNRVDGLTVTELEDGSTILRLQGSAEPTFNVYRLEDPPRLVVDMAASERGKAVPKVPLDNWACGRVSLDDVVEGGAKLLRVVVELKRDASYIAVPKGSELVLTVTPREVPPEAYFSRKSAASRRADIDRRDAESQKIQADASAVKAETDALNRVAADRARAAEDAAKAAEARAAAAKRAEDEAKAAEAAARKELAGAKSDRSALEQALAAAQAERTKLAGERAAAEAKLAKALAAAEAEQTKAAAARTRAEQVEATAKAEAAKVQAAAKRTAAEIEKQARDALASADTAMRTATAEQARAAQARKDAEQALAEAKGAAKSARKSDAEAVKRAVAQAEAAAKAARERQSQAEALLASLQTDKASLEQKLAEQTRTADELRKTIARKETQLAALERDARDARARLEEAKLGDRKEARQAVEHAETELRLAREALSAQRARADKLSSELDGAQSRLAKQVAKAEQPEGLGKAWERERERSGETKVRDVRFEDGPDASRVIVMIDGPAAYDGSTLTPTMELLRLQGAKIPDALERSLDASGFGGPVKTVTSFGEGADVKLIVATVDGTKPTLEEHADRLVWVFPRKTAARGAAPAPEVVSMAGTKVGGFASAPAPAMLAPMAGGEGSSGGGQRARWRGERIDIELQDAPIKDVLLLFSDIGRVNIIAGNGVTGQVTMKLTAVPWDQALDIILRSLNLGMTQDGNVIRVATLSDLEEERRKAIERANAQVQLKPLETRLVPVSYATVDEMLPKVQSVLSSRGTVTPDARTNTLIIMDVAENIALAEALVSQLDSQTPQVLIEARIVEARTNFLRQLGIQWGFDFTASPGTGNPTGLFFPNSIGVGGGGTGTPADTRGFVLPAAAANPNYAIDLPAPVGTGSGGAIGFSFGSINGNLNTNLRLSAAEEQGEVRIISAPKIVTLDNTQAQIEQGVQIPISQVSAQGVNTRFVNATLSLQVTPHVTNEGAVVLDVALQKNEADFVNTGARGDPTILTKQATTRMLVNDGDTAVIGGIYTRNKSVSYNKVPWLADIPIVGWFFKNKAEGDTREEVLIFLTPKIVNRASSIGG
jgi:type IV pilus assembly protein PilQ